MNFYKNIFEYNRIGRFDYFLLLLSNNIILIFFSIIIASLDTNNAYSFGFFGLLLLFILAFFGILASIKRFHDINMSGWHCLWLFIPFISIIFHLILLFKSGDEGLNRFGPSPKDLKNLEKENPNNLENNFQKIKELFEKGLISKEEYKTKKEKILDNLENDFQKIKELFEKGLISKEEYEAKKEKILDL